MIRCKIVKGVTIMLKQNAASTVNGRGSHPSRPHF